MEIPLQARVECTDGVVGRSLYVLIDPVRDLVTNVVVKEDAFPHTQYIVPLETISTTVAGTIRLNCSEAELQKMAPFVQTEYIEEKMPAGDFRYVGGMYGAGSYYLMPYLTPEITVQVPSEQLQIPAGELAVKRGARVEATDGYVGKVDEFVINSKNGHITYLVMEEGHLWGKKNVIIPLSALGETRDGIVFLKLDKHGLESLPTFSVGRHWS